MGLFITRSIFFATLLIGLSAVNSAHAQQNQETTYRATGDKNIEPEKSVEYIGNLVYAEMARRLMEEDGVNVDFVILRSQYIKSEYYDPIGDEALEHLQMLAILAQTADSPQEQEEMFWAYRTLLQRHIAHIGMVAQAIVFSKEDPRFGDVNKLRKIRNGLFNSIVHTGDGREPGTAFEIITLAEETAVLRNKRYKVTSTEHLERGIMRYNVHEIITDQGIKGVAFMNVTFPMKHLEKLKLAKREK